MSIVIKIVFTSFFCIVTFFVNSSDQQLASKPVQMKENAMKDYAIERSQLTIDHIYNILDQGAELASQTTMSTSLATGGTALFPHTYIAKCGDQIAAVVHSTLEACQKTGKNQILLIGVVHRLTDTLAQARKREMNWEDLTNEPCRGIFGPGLANEEILCKEFCLDNFIFLLEHASKRKDIPVPKVIMRYPNLVRGQPELLNGIKELEILAKESIVVATSDLCHHGTAYGLTVDQSLPIGDCAYQFARKTIEKNLELLSGNDLLAYRQYCLDSVSDSMEVGQLLHHILGPLEGHIRDLKLIDVADLFENNPQPNWVAATLVELKSKTPSN